MALTPETYINNLPDDRKSAVSKLRDTIKTNLPDGFEECISYGMIGYVVPHTLYPAGYHCDPKLPLPFISLASQKSHIALYHMGLYADKELMSWFCAEFEKNGMKKPDMGKSCIRFKKPEQIPFEILAALCRKMDPKDWIQCYELAFRKH